MVCTLTRWRVRRRVRVRHPSRLQNHPAFGKSMQMDSNAVKAAAAAATEEAEEEEEEEEELVE
jgi:hypothetical protein